MKKVLYIALMIVVCLACKNEVATPAVGQTPFKLINAKNTYIAGETIEVQFIGDTTSLPYLWISNAFGSAILEPTIKDNQHTFSLPKTFTKKSGVCTWRLVQGNSIIIHGKITIEPHPKRQAQIETYLGPPSIVAGEIDYTMLVAAPVDNYDNPLVDSTRVSVKKQFNATIEEATLHLKNGVAWKNLYAPKKSGRILIAASSHNTISKELTTIVHPANGTDFNIAYHRNHSYADGNQVITFSTDIIKDEFENIVSDGTLVTFTITDSSGMLLQTMGTTINGIAKGQMLHPDESSEWSVTAYVTGTAQSNKITLSFEPAIEDYRVTSSVDGRTIYISQMQSFMGQFVPDGIPIALEIRSKTGALLETLRTTSRLGKAQFVISKDFYPNATYELSINASGITKTKTVQLK